MVKTKVAIVQAVKAIRKASNQQEDFRIPLLVADGPFALVEF